MNRKTNSNYNQEETAEKVVRTETHPEEHRENKAQNSRSYTSSTNSTGSTGHANPKNCR